MNEPHYIIDHDEQSPPPGFRFGIGAMLSWTVSISAILAAVGNFHGPGSPWPLVILVSLPLVCIPPLVQKLFEKTPNLNFSSAWQTMLLLFVCIQPVLMLMGSTVVYSMDWRGKGTHWFYYILDAEAGVTWWPIFLAGGVMMGISLFGNKSFPFLQITLLTVLANAFISCYYVIAGAFFKYVMLEYFALMAPFSACICYLLFCCILIRFLKFHHQLNFNLGAVLGLTLGWVVLTLVKIPLAMGIYDRLPAEPVGCFVVTAAAKGHRRWVGSWFDSGRGGLVNQQLLVMWRFERWLATRFPSFHKRLRWVYNKIGPVVAIQIRYRWQADLVFILLKPIEWTAAIILRFVR